MGWAHVAIELVIEVAHRAFDRVESLDARWGPLKASCADATYQDECGFNHTTEEQQQPQES
jgi:hypothetical protein